MKAVGNKEIIVARATAIIRISGSVQGVFFRVSAEEEAEKLGLSLRADNQPDGTVRIEAAGEREALEKLVDWCRGGPPLAKVANVEVTYIN